jgi:hypothetical protein
VGGGGGGGEMNYTNADGGVGVTSSRLKNYNGSTSLNLCINQKLSFPIEVKDLPRASRVLFRLWGWRKKKKSGAGVDANSTNAVFLGWVACTVFDFKGDDVDDHSFFYLPMIMLMMMIMLLLMMIMMMIMLLMMIMLMMAVMVYLSIYISKSIYY